MSKYITAIFAIIAIFGALVGVPAWGCAIAGVVALFSAIWAMGTWEEENCLS